MAYTNFSNCTVQEYRNIIYSQDAKNKLKIYFNNVELENADLYCEKIEEVSRILPDDGSKRFSLDTFFSTNLEITFHNINTNILQDQVEIHIGTLVDASNNIYEYVPIGIFNIQDAPENDKDKITLTLRDNRIKFDFNYNAQPLIERLGGAATKKQILDDICSIAGVINTVSSFNGDSDLVGTYDSTIKGSTYVAYLFEQAGLIPVIDRQGRLAKIDLDNLYIWQIPLSILETGYEIGEPYQIDRVVYESGIIKYESSNDETLDTLYIDSSNPYISNQSQIDYIYNKLQNFKIDSVLSKKVLGNPAIDPFDLIQVYNDIDNSNDIIFTTLANKTFKYTGAFTDVYDTQIGKEQRTENVSLNGQEAFKKYAKTSIDNLTAEINLISSETMIFSNEVFGVGSLTLSNAHKGTLHRLEITGNISSLYPSNNLYPSNDLYPLDTYLVVDNNKYLLDINYLNFVSENEYDKYVYEDGKQWIERADGTIEESDKEILIQVDSNSTLAMENYNNVVLKSKYLIQNDYTSTFTNAMDIVSQINVSPGDITIKSHKLKLEGYTTINGNFKVDLDGNMYAKNGTFEGNVYLGNGGKVIGGDGLLSNLQFNSIGIINGWCPLGFNLDDNNNILYQDLCVDYSIPKNFTIISAYLTLYTIEVMSAYLDGSYKQQETTGKPKQLKLYNGITNNTYSVFWGNGTSYFFRNDLLVGSEIENAFGSSTYTPDINGVGNVNTKVSIDIKDNLINTGENNQLIIRTNITKPSSYTSQSDRQSIAQNTGIARCVLNILGYMSIEEEG